MRFTRVRHDDADALAQLTALAEAARLVDDPDSPPQSARQHAGWLRYGWDNEPGETWLGTPDAAAAPVAVLTLHLPERDNRHAVAVGVTVHPEHRRHGHGTAVLAEALRRAEAAGRATIWMGGRDGDPAGTAFAQGAGFVAASRDARRRQVLAEVDAAAVDDLERAAIERSGAYDVQRLEGVPTSDDVLAELIEVTESINDAPAGTLTWEREVFDMQRLRDFEAAAEGRGERVYRVIARRRDTGVVGGHTVVMIDPEQPEHGVQADTAVHREHRGHRLGARLKIDMMRWLADQEPQLSDLVTWNNADNDFMISINEAIGYRLHGVFVQWERTLDS